MIQRIAAITSALGVATIAITSIVDFLNAIEKHRMRNHSTEYQKQHRSEHNGKAELLMKPVDNTNIGRTEGSFPKKDRLLQNMRSQGIYRVAPYYQSASCKKNKAVSLTEKPGEYCRAMQNLPQPDFCFKVKVSS